MTQTVDNDDFFWPSMFKEVDEFKLNENDQATERENTHSSVIKNLHKIFKLKIKFWF
jgi:hypothetical protein